MYICIKWQSSTDRKGTLINTSLKIKLDVFWSFVIYLANYSAACYHGLGAEGRERR